MPASECPSTARSSAWLALGRAGTGTRLRASESCLGKLQDDLQASHHETDSTGEGEWVRSNPLRGVFVRVRLASKGWHGHNAFGKRSLSKTSMKSTRAAIEPWLLVACVQFAAMAPRKLVRLYRQRMQIEESFRGMKSQHFGEGLECNRSSGIGRFTVLVLIASLGA